MPSATYTALATTTLASSASSVTFSSISGSFRDLVLVANFKSVVTGPYSNAYPTIKINSDGGSNYSSVRMQGDGSSTGSSTQSGTEAELTSSVYASTTNPMVMVVSFQDYSATDKHKSFLSRCDASGSGTSAGAHRWASTSAVTSFSVQNQGSVNFAAGSTFSLFGIASA